MRCHKCKWNVRIERGDFRGVPWEKTPCSQCELVESSEWTLEYKDVIPAPDANSDGDSEEMSMPLSVMCSLVRGLMSLPTRTRDAICLRYQGLLYREIAVRFGVTMAAIEVKQTRAMNKWTALEAMFPVKVAKRAMRAQRRASVGGGRSGAGCQKRLTAGGNTGSTIQSRKNKCKRKTGGRGKTTRENRGR
jgi:hypothetical protein